MGLERLSTVLQHVKSNYETDALACLVRAAARETGVAYSQDVPSLKVIADHIRACCFMVADGILPSNEGRGYVLRRIARRAIRHGYKLGQKGLFFHKIAADLVAEMGDAYPELREKQAHIEDALRAEEIKFAETLEIGMGLVDSALEGGKTALDGDTIFKLYDTFGFPVVPDRRHLPRARHPRRPGRLRARDGSATRARSRRLQFQDDRQGQLQRRRHLLPRL